MSHFPSLLPPKIRELPEREEVPVPTNGGRIDVHRLQSWRLIRGLQLDPLRCGKFAVKN